MSIFPRPLKKVLGKIIPFSKEDKVPTFNLGDGVADGTTFLRGDGTWASPGSSGYVPYVGATQDVDLGIYRLIADAVSFDLNPVNAPGAGQIAYDGASGALSYLLNSSNVVSRIGQTMHAYVHNAEAVTITKGQAVYLFSASGNKASVKLASNTSDATSAKTFGLAAENIGAGQNGMVICQGVLDGLNTGMYTAGDILYLGSTPGSYTTIKTYAPNHFVYIGIVERANAGNGQIYVRVQNGYELDEIHDVDLITAPPVSGNVLTYNGSLWVPQAPGGGGLTVGTTAIASGTVGRILFQNGGNVLGQDSALFWDNTNKRLGIGATPSTNVRLDVRAQGALSTDIAFRVRNSADTADILTVAGNRTVWARGGGNQATNTAFGETTFYNNTTGTENVAIGYGAMEFSTAAYRSVAIGTYALNVTTIEGANTAVGYAALRNSGYHYNNTAIGSQALLDNTTGIENTAVGSNAFRRKVTGNGNIAIGVIAAEYVVGGAGCTATSTSIFIGNYTKPNANSQSNQIVIGYQAEGLGSNTTVIGNTSTTLFRPYGNVAIGANTASARLDVRAQGALSTDIAFRVRNSADTANLYSIDGLGNVIFNASSGANPFIWNHAGTLQMKLEVAGNSGLLRVYNNGVLRHDIDGRDYASFKGIKINGVGGGVNFLNIGSAVSNSKFNVDIAGDPILDVFNSTNLNVIRFDSRGGEGAIQVRTVSSPTTSIVDGFKQYSADIVAGNAAPHFRTETGDIVKLFKGAALTASDGTLANAVTRIAELEARLQAHGLIA